MVTQAQPATSRRTTFTWLGVGTLVFALSALWALATPPMAGPDEPSHVVKAAAVARGQVFGTPNPVEQSLDRPGAGTLVRLPSDYLEATALPNCFAFQQDVPASCQPDDLDEPAGQVQVETFAGQYPPLYYALVGWPSLFLDASASIVAMRLVSALLAAALLTWGSALLLSAPVAGPRTTGLLVAVSPMVLFLAGTVNPAGFEIAAAFCLWAAGLRLAVGTGPVERAPLVAAGVAAALLIGSRATGPVWAAAILVVLLVAAPGGRWRTVLAHRDTRWVGPLVVLATALSGAWIVTHGGVVTTRGLFPQYEDPQVALLDVLGNSWSYMQNIIGNFGWLDAPAPPLTFTLWLVALGALLVGALASRAPARSRAALGLVLLGTAAAPVVLQLPTAADTGLIWQGRYVLPLAVGVPLLAGVLLPTRPDDVLDHQVRTARLVSVVVLVAQVGAFWWGSRRYAEGLQGQLITLAPDWSSPVGFLPGVAAYAACCAAVVVLVHRTLASSPGHGGLQDDEVPATAAQEAQAARA